MAAPDERRSCESPSRARLREQALTKLARTSDIRVDLRGGPEPSAADGFHDRALYCSEPSKHVLPERTTTLDQPLVMDYAQRFKANGSR